MAKVQYFTASSLDGYITDEHNSLDWLFELPEDDDEDDGFWDEWFSTVGGLVMGATTYEWMLDRHQMLDNPDEFRRFYGERPAWVFSHRDLPLIPGIELTLAQGDVAAHYGAMEERLAGANLWIVGGGDLVGQFHDAGLLDEIIVDLAPVTLGAGAPLLPRRITSKQLAFGRVARDGARVRLFVDVTR